MSYIEYIISAIAIAVATFLLRYSRRKRWNKQLRKQEQREDPFLLFKVGIYQVLFWVSLLLSNYKSAEKHGKKLLAIYRECGATAKEKEITKFLLELFEDQYKYAEAKELCERLIDLSTETGNQKAEGWAYTRRGLLSYYLGENVKAREYLEKALTISVEIGDTKGEATCHINLGTVLTFLSEYIKAKEHLEKGLAIKKETGDRAGEATACATLGGGVLMSLSEHEKAKEHLENALAISMEIGDRKGEAAVYKYLGNLFQRFGEYVRAKEYHEKDLAITIEIGDRYGEASSYGDLATVFHSLHEYMKSKEYYKKALSIEMEIGDRQGEGNVYGNLGTVFQSLGQYTQAKRYHEKALAIRMETGNRNGTATDYGNLGTVLQYLGEHVQAKKYHKKALAINLEIGNKCGEARAYGNLGSVFKSLGEYTQAKEYYEKALAIRMEIGDRDGEAASYQNLGALLQCLGEYPKAKEYHEKAVAIETEIGDRAGEATSYGNLGVLFLSLDKPLMAEEYLKKALSISKDIGAPDKEFQFCCNLTVVKLSQGKIQEAFHYMLMSIKISEDLRGFLGDNDQFKISFLDVHVFPYRKLSEFFCLYENPNNALYVLELERARALADLMTAQYSVQSQITANPQSWIGIENIMKKESNCTCLYISYHAQHVFLWILGTSGVIHFRRKTANESDADAKLSKSLVQFFSKSFRDFGALPKESCEDRSLNSKNRKPNSSQKKSLADLRLVEEDDEGYQDREPLFYKMLIAPVTDLLVEPEIIIVPESTLYHVPFAALQDEDGKYLSQTFRIRIVPSLTTLKLVQDSPADYHSQAGALIVDDPVVGRVLYKGYVKNKEPLPCARKEAEMIGRLLGVEPLLGEHATRQAVLQRIHSVSLIHFAAHGNAERGEIALSPVRSTNRIPEEEEYLLTISDISQVQLRANLVVLSCCHSGSGQIRAEGVIGIARAFLGSGARSVLVALWALEDSATEQLMRCFYEHLVRRESASECLHEAMKWMRCNGYSDVMQWAPFMLIGDNVTFDFGEKVRFI